MDMDKDLRKFLKILISLILIIIIFVWIIIILIKVISHPYFKSLENANEITLRIEHSANVRWSSGWQGQKTWPSTHNFSYIDLETISSSIFWEGILPDDINQKWANEYIMEGEIFYIELGQKNNNDWYEPIFVTNDYSKIEWKTFIISEMWWFWGKVGDFLVYMRYSNIHIHNSNDILPLTDFIGISSKGLGDRYAVIKLDKNWYARLDQLKTWKNICAIRGYVDFSNTKCWSDKSDKFNHLKKYSYIWGKISLIKKFLDQK